MDEEFKAIRNLIIWIDLSILGLFFLIGLGEFVIRMKQINVLEKNTAPISIRVEKGE